MNIKTTIIIGIMLIVIISNTLDLLDDFTSGEPWWHIIEESVVISLALGLITYLVFNLKQQARDMIQLRTELQNTEQSLAHSNSRMQQARKEYSQLIHQQFNEWHLSQSEQEIALLMLKGLSFNEIAALRQTKEKTVRQQASEIYKKTGVTGRHAFSAWFFEDFLN